MIDPQTYTASVNNGQGDARMAGYVPVAGQEKAVTEAQNFSRLVQNAQGANPAGSSANTAAASSTSSSSTSSSSSSGHHGFLDFLTTIFDIINPLEHLPVISTIYEHVTGHHMNPVARIAGDTLYGGPIGTAVGVANVISEKKTGKDLGENVVAMLSGKNKSPKGTDTPGTALAQNNIKASDIIWNDAPSGGKDGGANTDADTALASAAPGMAALAPAASASTPAPMPMPKVSPSSAIAAASAASVRAPRAHIAAPDAAKMASAGTSSGAKQNFSSAAAKPSHGAATTGKTLADYVALRPLSASVQNRAPASGNAVPMNGAASTVASDSTPGSVLQSAPADAQERAVPPGQFAQQMMDGLDKYSAMMKAQTVAAPASSFSATF